MKREAHPGPDTVRLPIISLWQPWASLIFERVGAMPIKRHETRKMRPPQKYVGGYIGIHSTASFPARKFISEELHELCCKTFGAAYREELPRGVILGAVIVGGAYPTDQYAAASHEDAIAGDWSPGRFAWPLVSPHKFPALTPAKGKQGWWSYNVDKFEG